MANILTAIGIPVSEGQGYAGVISNVQINDYRNVLDTIETLTDLVQIPSNPNPMNPNYGATSTTTSSPSVCVNAGLRPVRSHCCKMDLL